MPDLYRHQVHAELSYVLGMDCYADNETLYPIIQQSTARARSGPNLKRNVAARVTITEDIMQSELHARSSFLFNYARLNSKDSETRMENTNRF